MILASLLIYPSKIWVKVDSINGKFCLGIKIYDKKLTDLLCFVSFTLYNNQTKLY